MLDDRRADSQSSHQLSPPEPEACLSIRDLAVTFPGTRGQARQHAVRDVAVDLYAGKVVGVAGESGSGKSMTASAIMGLLPEGALASGSIRYDGRELLGAGEKALRRLRGTEIALISQQTRSALNPVLRIGKQMELVARTIGTAGTGRRAWSVRKDRKELNRLVREGLEAVQLRDLERVTRAFPGQLSGGMCQRVLIAMALINGCKVLLADEPTTALDVTVQREILNLLRDLVRERSLALMIISHDLGVLGEICDELIIIYKGQVVEHGSSSDVLNSPRHPYTQGLLACLPRLKSAGTVGLLQPEFAATAGTDIPEYGCSFRPRCLWRAPQCESDQLLETLSGDGGYGPREVRCARANEIPLHVGVGSEAR